MISEKPTIILNQFFILIFCKSFFGIFGSLGNGSLPIGLDTFEKNLPFQEYNLFKDLSCRLFNYLKT